MRKFNLFYPIFSLVLFLTACSNDTTETNSTAIIADYITPVGKVKDLTINLDNNVYLLSYNQNPLTDLKFKKVNPAGTISELTGYLGEYYGENMSVFHEIYGDAASFANLFFTTDNVNHKNKILELDDTFVPKEKTHPLTSVTIKSMTNNGSDFILFDGNSHTMRYFYAFTNDIFLAGSDNTQIIDGEGSNAGLNNVSKIIEGFDGSYLIDSGKYLRKIYIKNGNYALQTIAIVQGNAILDIAHDTQGTLYALVEKEGIYFFDKNTNTLKPFKSGQDKIKTNPKTVIDFDWNTLKKMYINKNDMYLITNTNSLIKISDFKKKL